MIGHIFLNEAGKPVTTGTRVARVLVVNLVLMFLPFIAFDGWRKARTEQMWMELPCTIVSASVDRVLGDKSDDPYRVTLSYQFEFNRRLMVSSELKLQSDDAAEMYDYVRHYPTGLKTTCHVNPNDHHESALEPRSLLSSTVFVLSAVALVATVWLLYCIPQLRAIRVGVTVVNLRSSQQRRRREFWSAIVLVIATAGYMAWLGAVPLAKNLQAMSWPVVPCIVESRHLIRNEVHGEGYAVLYRPDVLYRYSIHGQEFHSNCYSKTDLSTPFYSGGKSRNRRERAAWIDANLPCESGQSLRRRHYHVNRNEFRRLQLAARELRRNGLRRGLATPPDQS